MAVPQLLNDIVNTLLLLAPSAALLCLVLAGISLRREGGGTSFLIGGGFTKWMFWAVLFLTLQPLLGWFSSFGVTVPLAGGGIASSWLSNFETSVGIFVTNFVVGRLATTLAAYFVLRAILDSAAGEYPLPSIFTAMFLLGVQTTDTILQSYNSSTQYATVDVLDSLWTYLAGTIMPIAAGLAIIGAIINVAMRRPALRLAGVALTSMLKGVFSWLLLSPTVTAVFMNAAPSTCKSRATVRCFMDRDGSGNPVMVDRVHPFSIGPWRSEVRDGKVIFPGTQERPFVPGRKKVD